MTVNQANPEVPTPAQNVTVVEERAQPDDRLARTGPRGPELARRVTVLLFGLVQVVIILRVVLLLLDARTGNALVSAILDLSQIFVAPFEGILRTDALKSGGSVLDVAAIVALVGWTVVELIVLWVIGIFRRDRA